MRGSSVPLGDRVYVGVSGGVDSMVLVHLLKELGFPVSIFHVDHGLRGAESAGDRVFVDTFARAAGIPFRAVEVDVHGRHAEGGVSLQMAARELRYAAFRELLVNGGVLALAHHRDDAVESLLLNLMRGTGLSGWVGMPAETALGGGRIVRPFLGVGRAEIAAYALENNIPFREDSSNADPKYLRNRVRAEVLPLLEELRPGALRTMGRSLDILREMGDLARKATGEKIARLTRSVDGALRIPFAELEPDKAPLLLLSTIISEESFHPDELGRLLGAAHTRSVGARFRFGGSEVVVERDHLLVLNGAAGAVDETIVLSEEAGSASCFNWEMVLPSEVDLGTGMRTAWLDADALQFPLLLRPWRLGDRMRPIGLSGSKLVSDLLTDAKVPHEQRSSAFVLLSGGNVIWLVGFRIGEGYQAVGNATRVFRVQAK